MKKKGFSVTTPLMGFVIFLIAAATAAYIMTESTQQLESIPTTLDDDLAFVAVAIDLDFTNVFLQNTLEEATADYMEAKKYRIDTNSDFMSNLGDGLRYALEEPLNALITERVSSTYAEAYDTLPEVQCSPESSAGGTFVSVFITPNDDGSLSVSADTFGHRIRCSSKEGEDYDIINLLGGDYHLSVRAVKYYDLAIATIKTLESSLGSAVGTYRGDSWKYPDDTEAKARVVDNWRGVVSVMALAVSNSLDGLHINPGSVQILSGSGVEYSSEEFSFACDGELGYYADKNCRPDDVSVSIGEDCEEGAEEVELEIQEPEVKIKITVAGISGEIDVNVEPILEALGIKDFFEEKAGIDTACISYTQATELCRAFKGKPNSATVSATIFEENDKYIPAGVDKPIRFSFISSAFPIDTSMVYDDVDCSSEDEKVSSAIFETIKILLQKGNFKLQIDYPDESDEESAEAEISGLEEIAEEMAQDRMYTDTGASITLNARARIEGEGSEELIASGSVSSEAAENGGIPQKAVDAVDTLTSSSPSGEWESRLDTSFTAASTGNKYLPYNTVTDLLDSAASGLSMSGQRSNAESIGKTSGAVCKLMGFKSFMEAGDMSMALSALCGIGNLLECEGITSICGMGVLFNVQSPEAMARAIEGILAGAGYSVLLDSAIFASLDFANAVDVNAALNLAASAIGADGFGADAAAYLRSISAILNSMMDMDAEAVLALVSGFLRQAGFDAAADLYYGIAGLEGAIKAGDIKGTLSAVMNMASSLGLGGIGDLGGLFVQASGAFSALLNLDGVLAQCMDSPPWDFVCTLPAVSGGVCPSTDKMIGFEDCTFSYGLPTFDAQLLCNEFIFEGGFQVDCNCIYYCPGRPIQNIPVPVSVRISLSSLTALLDLPEISQLLNLAQTIEAFQSIEYCRLDP
jgi:hypothetical protein